MSGIKKFQNETMNDYSKRVEEVINKLDDLVIKNGQIIARLPPDTLGGKALINSLTGILSDNFDIDEVKIKALREKYGAVH